METNNSHLDQKPTDNAEELKKKREFKTGITLLIIIFLLIPYFFYFLELNGLVSLILPFVIVLIISTTFFGIGFDDFFRLTFGIIEAFLGIGLFIMLLLGVLVILYGILREIWIGG